MSIDGLMAEPPTGPSPVVAYGLLAVGLLGIASVGWVRLRRHLG